MLFEEIVLLFAQRLAFLPDSKLNPDFNVSNIAEFDDIVSELLEDELATPEMINLAAHGARVFLRNGEPPIFS